MLVFEHMSDADLSRYAYGTPWWAHYWLATLLLLGSYSIALLDHPELLVELLPGLLFGSLVFGLLFSFASMLLMLLLPWPYAYFTRALRRWQQRRLDRWRP